MWKDSGPTMENSTYVPNHLPPPSLVVFSQAGGLPDALRMQRPFNPQVTDSKDLQVPFSTAASLGYGLHHMLHLPHQFLHPLDPRLPFGAFRPLGPSAFAPPSKCLKVETGSSSVSSGLSSIGPLSSVSNMFSPSLPSSGGVIGNNLSGLGAAGSEVAPQSPAGSASRSPLGNAAGSTSASNRGMSPEDDDRDASATPGSENTERSTPEEGRPYRLGAVFGGRCSAEALGLGLGLSLGPAYRFALPPGLASKTTRCLVLDQGKKKFPVDPSCCPVCSVTVRPQELEQHFAQELDRLYKISVNNNRQRQRSILPPPMNSEHPHGSMLHASSTADGTPQGRWETYKRIRSNRQARIRVKNRKRKVDEPACPVCSERLSGTPEELNQHVERCLHKHNGNSHSASSANLDDEEVDVEGDTETFEEYEWAGQRRIRATSMLIGGFSAAGLSTISSNRVGGGSGRPEEDEDLVVDGDDAIQFGPAQYFEADVIAPRVEGNQKEQKERDALREAVISPNATLAPHTPPDQSHVANIEVKPEPGTIGANNPTSRSSTPSRQTDDIPSSSPGRDRTSTPLFDALRNRIRELENEMRGQPFRCLICMEQYKKPVTSVCCWHVHCEQCWLHTLGAKKLCPQCNMITSPTDLRRIYM